MPLKLVFFFGKNKQTENMRNINHKLWFISKKRGNNVTESEWHYNVSTHQQCQVYTECEMNGIKMISKIGAQSRERDRYKLNKY